MIIAFTGEIGAGKTTVAKMLVDNHGYIRISFARRFKLALCMLLNWDISKIDDFDYKNSADRITGRVRREIMQEFATGYIRTMVDPILHTKTASLDTYDALINLKRLVVFDDLRHPDEVKFVKAIGGNIIKIIRPDNPFPQSEHISEKYQIPIDHTVCNNSTPEQLYYHVLDSDLVWRNRSNHYPPLVGASHKIRKYIEKWESVDGESI